MLEDRQAALEQENAELRRQLDVCHAEIKEAREQQTATAEVLQVINSSPGDLAPVFNAILEKAHALCGADHGHLSVYEGGQFRALATHAVPEAFAKMVRQPFRPGLDVARRLLSGEIVIQFDDMAGLSFDSDDRIGRGVVELAGARTLLIIALRRDDALLGYITAHRTEVRPFADKQIALLQNFAAQAVIAMENARLLTETREALEQQTATAEVLQVINSSPGDLAPVFDAMLEKAVRLCDFAFAALWTYEGSHFHPVALHGMPKPFEEFLREHTPPAFDLLHGNGGPIHIADVMATELAQRDPVFTRGAQELGRVRTLLLVPLRKDEELMGVFVAYRQEVRPFTDKQIALLQNFAAQAVIAMENARLLTETREALEQQTATAEVLQVINSSPGDLAPVFDAILEKAHSLCGSDHGGLVIRDGARFHAVALHGIPEAFAELLRRGYEPRPDSPIGRLMRGEDFVHISDLAEVVPRVPDDPVPRAAVELGGMRTHLTVPLRREDSLLGAIIATRQEVRPFTDKQIALLQNFAAQAVIAIENARLLTETREALEQQTATAEVLQVINSSPGDLTPVFDAMLDKALRLCDAAFGALMSYDGEKVRAVSTRGFPPELVDLYADPIVPRRDGDSPYARFLRGEALLHIPDMAAEEVRTSLASRPRALVEIGGARTGLELPLRKDDALLGSMWFYRQEVRPFTDKQIVLLQNFAAQAVIAMENARLITETREALAQQTATAEVLQVINSSPGELAPVFDAMLERALKLCEAAIGALGTFDGQRFSWVASRDAARPYAEAIGFSVSPLPGLPLGRIAGGEQLVHIQDVVEIDDLLSASPGWRGFVDSVHPRTALWIALRKDSALLGVIVIWRQEVRPFSEKEIALLQNFAAQAVIAMENARLITETREALEQQTATAQVLQVINASPGDLTPVFDAMLEKAIHLCDAAFGTLWTRDGESFRAVALHRVPAAFADLLAKAPYRPEPGSHHERLMRGEPFAQTEDIAAETRIGPVRQALVEQGGARSMIAVPLRKDGAVLGVISAYRQEVRPFSDKQIALLQNFAAQAVIAMENARLLTETREALAQQTATAEVLQVINSSPGDLVPVFNAILEKAHTLCEASFGALLTYDGERFQPVALQGVATRFWEFIGQGIRPKPGDPFGHMVEGVPLSHIHDLSEVAAQYPNNPLPRAAVDLGGVRTFLIVPLRKDSALLGVITAYRQEVRPFTDKQISLLQNFAAQAVIAIENARLLGELQQRTSDLQESLDYQTAISEVLRVISGSAFDLDPVLQSVVSTAIRLCRADQAVIYRNVEGEYRWAAGDSLAPEYEKIERDVRIHPGGSTVVGRAALEVQPVHILDCQTDPSYEAKDDARVGGIHTLLGVPLLRDRLAIGVIGLARQRVEAFTEKEIALVTTFADQAVIAIENARLLTDLQQRTSDLQESLEYQTATSDVLKVISRSGAQLRPMLETLVETATRICLADNGLILELRDGKYHMAASVGFPLEFNEHHFRSPTLPGRGTVTGRVAIERRVVHIEDAQTDPEYSAVISQQLGHTRTMLGVPLFRGDTVAGVITLSRSRVEPFTEKQIALVTTFADQAVIAIENARLFNELRDRTAELGRSVEELKMLGEVGRAVSSTLDLRTVLSKILTASLGMTWANAGAIFRYIRAERAFRLVEAVGWDEALQQSVGDLRVPEAETAMGEAAAWRVPIQIVDLALRPSTPLRDASLAAGLRSALIVPLVGPERVFGALILQRREAGEFPAETVRLMETLANQSVLAIQNARLFREIADKSEQLALASQHKSQFLANMSHELRTPLNAILGYAELLVDGIYGVLPEKAQSVLERVQNNGQHLLALINDVLDLAKIEAGQLTLTLENYNLPELVRTVITATEPLATAKGLKFTTSLQEGLPLGHGDARRLSQVLLNLVGNAIKFTDQGEVEIRASADKGQFIFEVRDTGPGIADADQERIFGEFQQIDNTNTRKQGGTGLGLAISKRMVEMQGGMISVDSALGQGSTFRVILPIHVEPALEEAA